MGAQVLLGPFTIDPGSEERPQERGDFRVGWRRHLLDLPPVDLPSGHHPDPGRADPRRLFHVEPHRLVPEVVDRRRAPADLGGHLRVGLRIQGVRPARRTADEQDGSDVTSPLVVPPDGELLNSSHPSSSRMNRSKISAPRGSPRRRPRRRPASDRPATCNRGRRRPRALELADLLEARLRPHLSGRRRVGDRVLRTLPCPDGAEVVGEGVGLRVVDERQVAQLVLQGRAAQGLGLAPVVARQHRGGDDELVVSLEPPGSDHRRRSARADGRGVVVRRDLDGVVARDLDGHRLGAPVAIGGDPGAQRTRCGDRPRARPRTGRPEAARRSRGPSRAGRRRPRGSACSAACARGSGGSPPG